MGNLSARRVETEKNPGKYGDGDGLWLVVSPAATKADSKKEPTRKKWVLRFLLDGKNREMGLGSFPTVGLADARERALEARRLARSGVDPIAERQRDRGIPTFGELSDEITDKLAEGFRNEKHKAQWRMTLTVYAKPLRDKAVDKITTGDVLKCLTPIWTEKPETASRVRGRIERVLNAAKVKGFRAGENPAAWRGHLDNLLPRQSKLARGHHAALAYQDIAAFMKRLRERPAIAARALEFAVLTAARSGEVLGASWEEIDLEGKVWTIPAERMKSSREHCVPLSATAVAIVEQMAEAKVSDFVFPGQRDGRPLSTMALEMVLRRMKVEGSTVHGFRSSFRDWAGNETHFPRELAEHALAHVIGDKAEQAYRRSDALERRRALMDAWAAFCFPKTGDSVVTLRARRLKGFVL